MRRRVDTRRCRQQLLERGRSGVGAWPEHLREIADKHDLFLIEDNAHGLGASWDGQVLGTFGEFSTLSFHETKNITCGQGGALQINDIRFIERAEILREKGTDRSRFLRGQVDKDTWVDVGSSYVLSDLLAGVLCGQLERYGSIQDARHNIWNYYHLELASWAERYDVRCPRPPARASHSPHLYHLRFRTLETRDRFIQHLRDRDIAAVFHYHPLHLSLIGFRLGGRHGQRPISEDAGVTLVRLPLHLGLQDGDLDKIVSAVTEFVP